MKAANRNVIIAIVLVLSVMAAMAFAAQESGKMKVQIPSDPELYSKEPQPLTAQQCAQCHPSIFQNLKNEGKKHRFDCQKCHTAFHVFNPKKANYDAIMPKCDTCHDQPHGPKVTDCSTCHTNPHTPRKVTMSDTLAKDCSLCHPGPQEQLDKFKSKHSKVACNRCHTAHGLKPSCSNCHKPHSPGQEFSTCTKCHPVHRPLQVTYADDTPAATCGACHTTVYAKLKNSPSKHSKVNCAMCHKAKHKYVPQCSDCHGATPHYPGIHIRFPKCLTCHLDVHDLPVRSEK